MPDKSLAPVHVTLHYRNLRLIACSFAVDIVSLELRLGNHHAVRIAVDFGHVHVEVLVVERLKEALRHLVEVVAFALFVAYAVPLRIFR